MPNPSAQRQFRPRLERLPTQELKNDLRQTLQSSFIAERLPGGRADIDRVLNVIEDTGTIPGDVIQLWQNWPNPEERKDLLGALKNLQNIVSKLPSARAVFESLKTPEAIASEAGLTERELEERAAALSQLPPVVQKPIDFGRVKQAVLDVFSQTDARLEGNRATDRETPIKLGQAAEIAAALLSGSSPRTQAQKFFVTLGPAAVNDITEKLTELVSPIVADEIKFSKPMETEADLARIEDILAGRRARATGQRAIESFITGLPEELAAGRRPLIESERRAGAELLEKELFPSIREQLTLRGIQFGGDLPFELARATGSIQRNLEQFETGLANDDDIFFQNAAYQTALQKALEAKQDIGLEIGVQRAAARTQQQSQFSERLGQLAAQKEVEFFRRQQEVALAAQNAKLRQQQEQAKAAGKKSLFQSIFEPALQIGTAFGFQKAFGGGGTGTLTT